MRNLIAVFRRAKNTKSVLVALVVLLAIGTITGGYFTAGACVYSPQMGEYQWRECPWGQDTCQYYQYCMTNDCIYYGDDYFCEKCVLSGYCRPELMCSTATCCSICPP